MEPSEAPLDRITVNRYAVTINVSPKKHINAPPKGQYGTMDEQTQKCQILNVVGPTLHSLGFAAVDFEHRFEKTKHGVVHLHGILQCTQEEILTFQYKVHLKLGMPRLPPHICCYIEKTRVSASYFQEYMNKEYIPERSMFIKDI